MSQTCWKISVVTVIYLVRRYDSVMASGEIPEISVDGPANAEAGDHSNASPQESRRVEQSNRLSTSPDKCGSSSEGELSSSVSSVSNISGMSAINKLVASQSSQLRCSLRRELSDGGSVNPMWRLNRISGTSEEFEGFDTAELEFMEDSTKTSNQDQT